MVAVLVKVFGFQHLELAEDVVQDALLTALEKWKFSGLPENPKAWLYTTAKNKALDILRKGKHELIVDLQNQENVLLTSSYSAKTTMNLFWQEEHIRDDFLGMMYACCHPEISADSQTILILKSLCGFSTKEIARAFLCSEDSVSKRLYRTKEFFRKSTIVPQIPIASQIPSKTDAVLNAIYLVFNEGYNATHVNAHIRQELITQAMMLCKALLDYKPTRLPKVYALMSIICFHAARTKSRLSEKGQLILLAAQDRMKWNQELIEKGNAYLNKSAFGDTLSLYHLEAAIAHEHCNAKKYTDTNWQAIISYYDTMLIKQNDPIIALNRSLAILECFGPQQALKELTELAQHKVMQDYYLYYAALGEVKERLFQFEQARTCYQKALNLTKSKTEHAFLKLKITELTSAS